jgi:DNA polymerase-3 subunit alpha
VLLTVDVRTEEESLRLMVADAMALDQAVANTAAGLKIYLRETAPLASIQQILNRAGRGKGKVQICVDLGDTGLETDLGLKDRFAISPAVRGAIKAIPGVTDIQDA